MSTFVKTSVILGAILTLAGSLLPWWREGDFVSYWTYGLRLYPSIKDNGGLLIVLLTLVVIILVFQPPNFIENPLMWNMLLSVALVLASIFHIGKLFTSRVNAGGFVGAPLIQIGLILVSIGSIFLLFSAVLSYFRSSS